MRTFHDQLRSIALDGVHLHPGSREPESRLDQPWSGTRLPSRFAEALDGVSDAARVLSPIAVLLAFSSFLPQSPSIPGGSPLCSLHPSLVLAGLSRHAELFADTGNLPSNPAHPPRVPDSGPEEKGPEEKERERRRASRDERQLFVAQRLLVRAQRALEVGEALRACTDLERFDSRYRRISPPLQTTLVPPMQDCLVALDDARTAKQTPPAQRALLVSYRGILSDKLGASMFV